MRFTSAALACLALGFAFACSEPAGSLTRGPTRTLPPGPDDEDDDGGDEVLDGGGSRGDGGGARDSGVDGSSGGEPGSLVPGKTTRSFSVASKQRSVLVVVPAKVKQGKVPLVVALHGNGDSAANFIATSSLETLAGQRGFVLAAPDGITQTITVPNAGTVPNVAWDAYRTEAQGNIDLPLLDAVVDDLVASGSIDEAKISTYGYSQGGYLSFRYGVDRSARLACAAVIAAANPIGPQLTAGAARKILFSMQIGTNDYGISQARATRDDLTAKSFPLDYVEVPGAGHSPFPGDKAAPLDHCLARSLP